MDVQPEVKPFLEYDELIKLLTDRGMIMGDPLRAQRKLTQVGYYRLSGYFYPSRRYALDLETGHRTVHSTFRANTKFNDVFEYYLMDKKMRTLLLDAIERIEVYFRTIISHEIGRISPLAHLDAKQFSKESLRATGKGPSFDSWHQKHNDLLASSKEDSIVHYRENERKIPIWVASEAWDFGCMSKFYSMLNGSNQDLICNMLGVDNRKVIDNWLININGLRNRCAHHARVCNRPNPRNLLLPRLGYFNTLSLSNTACSKLYGMICVIWFLLKKIGPSSTWISRVADVIDSKPDLPGLTYRSMGFSTEGFPRSLFPEISVTEKNKDICIVERFDNDALSLEDGVLKIKETGIEMDQVQPLSSILERIIESSCDIEYVIRQKADECKI
ncbi:Abi family protein [Aeromonas sp.]|uniref:Abi family protein n=1 Tax=Aeromonas sp. TaxID=647 RepID=UPI0025892F45|nr:Abi family protein [Aeromonas sp.]MCX7134973.1 Abi family protein [Aeromonas sp.]